MENNFSLQYNDFFQREEVKNKYNKNNSILNELNNFDFSSIEILYSLLDDYFSLKDDSSLQIIKNKLNNEKFNIKGILEKYTINNKIIEDINGNNEKSNIFEIELVLKKVSNTNKIEEINNKYYIKLIDINKDFMLYLSYAFKKYYNPILVITNLETLLELNEIKKYIIKFKNTKNSKIFIEINKMYEQLSSKSNIVKMNNVNEIKNISYQKLNENRLKKFCISSECFFDIKNFLEIGTETLYVENLKNEYYNGYLLKAYNINICCLVKKIGNNDNFLKRKNHIYIILENIFDLNQIILEAPNTHDIIKDLKINGIYIFKNLTCFIDENFNVKFGVIQLDSNKSTKIGLYYITDINEYNRNKIKNLYNMPFSHLIQLTTENKLVRSLQKYLININSVMYINAHMINNNIFYEGCLVGSDGTSSGFFLIEQDSVKNLFKFDSDFDNYIRNKLYQEKKFQIFPGRNDYNFNEYNILKVYGTQVIIIGTPKMNRLMEISAQDMYDNISELKKYLGASREQRIEGFLEFDTRLTKIEFSMINGSFSRKSDKLEKIPYIKSSYLFDIDDYLKLASDDNINNKI